MSDFGTASTLVVFDCDGVLVDSEALTVEVEAELLSQAGFAITAQEITERYVGLSYTSMMADLGERFGRPVPDSLSRSVQQAVLDHFPEHLQPIGGIGDLLGALAEADIDRCVASSSDLDRIWLSLTVTELAPHFAADTVFSAQMVDRGKPAPDLFLLAASKIGFEPDQCVVIEDSPGGVQAAVAAGMDVVGFVAGGHATPALPDRLRRAGAATVVNTTDELRAYLARRLPVLSQSADE